jgi:hypothetical protein
MQGDFLGTLESIASAFKFLVENVDKLIALFAGAKMVQAFSAMASGFTTMGIAAAGALGPIGLIMGALIALIPVAIDLGNKLGEALALKTALKTTTKRESVGFLSDRFATEARAKEAGEQEAIIREAQGEIEGVEEAGRYWMSGKQFYIRNQARSRIMTARAKIESIEREDASAIALRKELAAQADDPGMTQGPQAPAVTTPKRRRGGGRKSKAKAKPKSATTLEEVLAADPAQLESMAASTPSTKAIEPTVAVDITNNNFSFDIDQIIRSNAEPGEVAREAALAIKKEFQTRLAAAGQQLQPNLVR